MRIETALPSGKPLTVRRTFNVSKVPPSLGKPWSTIPYPASERKRSITIEMSGFLHDHECPMSSPFRSVSLNLYLVNGPRTDPRTGVRGVALKWTRHVVGGGWVGNVRNYAKFCWRVLKQQEANVTRKRARQVDYRK